ncbi:MAG: glycosyltransferase [Ruminococcus flavefaciens]|nr:glycosyltransferase [Ruminococcus flavefaciens]
MNKVLHVKSRLDIDGASVVEYGIAREIKDRWILDWLVESYNPHMMDVFCNLGSKVYTLENVKSNVFIRKLKKMYLKYKFYKTHDYKIVYFDTDSPLIVQDLIVALIARVPFRIVHAHGANLEGKANIRVVNLYRKMITTFCTKMIACSESAASWVFGYSNINDVSIIYNGIDTKRFSFDKKARDKIRRKMGLTDEFVIGHVGRFSKIKNQIFIIECFSEIVKNNRNIKLLMVGAGECENQIFSDIKERNISDKVIIVENTNKPEYFYNAMDLFVLPSLSEGFPLVGVEAQASGLPCIFSNVVPKAIKTNDAVYFLELRQELWIKKIMEIKKDINLSERTKCFLNVEKKGFDTKMTAAKIINELERMN